MKGAVYVTPSTKVIPSLSFNYVGKYLSTTYTSVHIQHSWDKFFFSQVSN